MNSTKSRDSEEDLLELLLQKPNDDIIDAVKENPLCQSKKGVNDASTKNLFNRRKRLIAVIAAMIFLLFFNSMLSFRSSDNSHVQGMNATSERMQSSTIEVTPKPEHNTTPARSTTNEQLHPWRSTATTASTKTSISSNLSTTTRTSTNSTILLPPSGYLVWSDKCKIPSIDPYTPEVMQFFKRQKYEACSKSKPLTRVVFNSTANKYTILINDDQVKNYAKSGEQLDCCYQVIERKSEGKKADLDVSLSKCLSFKSPAQLPNTTMNILVRCKSKSKEVYINGHPMMPEHPEIRQRLNEFKQKQSKKPLSVLMLGIDSISRVNLIRAMPKTAQYLNDNKWFEMTGYNKVDDNTFPNLMAILTGYNRSTTSQICTPTKLGGLDRCPLIWKNFRENGYVTAYAEDESWMSTFNFVKQGFEKPPVDYYLRPFMLTVEHNLTIKKKSGLMFCLGYQHSADYIYDYAYELATRYRNEPYFGLFWANTFSHGAISDSSSMDEKIVEYLNLYAKSGILDQSIVIFFSDHGMRFGPTRKFLSGYLEERLPFMFVWLPPSLRNSHPEFVNALNLNKNRLTNPYDVHMTLKHILELSGRAKNLSAAHDCPKCQSLLKPVPQSRSCDDVAIEEHWCTCIPFVNIDKSSSIVKKITEFTINYINNYIAEYKNGTVADKCALLSLKNIEEAYRHLYSVDTSNIWSNMTVETYRITFTTKPNDGRFEATVRYSAETKVMEVTGNISRLNMYASDSYCVSYGDVKKYCSCAKGVTRNHAAERVPLKTSV